MTKQELRRFARVRCQFTSAGHEGADGASIDADGINAGWEIVDIGEQTE